MAIPQIEEIQNLALNYSKAQLASLARTGQLDPEMAVMAGMMQDRIQKANAQPPSTTVAEDVLMPQMPQGVQGIEGLPQEEMAAAEPQAQEMPVGMEGGVDQAAGLEALPIPEDMYDEQSMAGGGIVAFEGGGDVKEEAGLGAMFGKMPENTDIKKLRSYIENQIGDAEKQARNDVLDAISMAGIEYARTGKLGEAAAAGSKQYFGAKSERKKDEFTRLKTLADLSEKERSAELESRKLAPEAVRGAEMIRAQAAERGAPVPTLEQALKQYTATTTKPTDVSAALQYGRNTIVGQAMKDFAAMTGVGGPQHKLAKAANGDEKALKELGLRSKEEAASALARNRTDYINQNLMAAGIPPTGKRDIPEAAAGAAKQTGLALPKTKDQLQQGQVYNTARGPATWDGRQFIPVR